MAPNVPNPASAAARTGSGNDVCFGGDTTGTLDAIDPNKLRELVEDVIVRHLPPDKYEVLIEAEKIERTLFQGLAGLVKQLAQRNAPDGGSAP